MLTVEHNYVTGLPQTAVPGWEPRGVPWHWSAGGSGRAGWDATVRYLVNARYIVNASYHGGFWGEHASNHIDCKTIIQWVVPTTKAAHSLAPSRIFQLNANKPRALQEARFTEVRRILGAKATDPNAACIAVAYAGMPADLARDRACPVFMADVRNLAAQLAAHPATNDRPHFGHGWIQPITRYEMDLPEDFVSLLYQEPVPEPVPEEPADMPTPPLRYVPQLWTANPGGAELREQAALSAPVVAMVPAGVPILTLGEAASGPAWRLAVAGDPERLFYIRRSQITDLPPGSGRDPALYAGISAVVAARMAGQPVPGDDAQVVRELTEANVRFMAAINEARAALEKAA